MWLTRSLGIALHPTSLPGGRLGREAFAFVDWLAAAGARWWQVLPLNPPDEHGSPYASASAFAAWPGLLADPDAGVAPSEVRAFEQRHRYWISDWATTPAAMPSRSRCDSTVSGRSSEPTLPAAACGSSATSRSTSRRVAATT